MRLDTLQAGRAVAALMVVVQHANLAATHFVGGGYNKLNYGYLGVDFFFVLSGFIIFHTASSKSRNKQSAVKYFLIRVSRIFIPYLPIGLLMAIMYSLMPEVSQSARVWSWVPTLTLLPWSDPPALSVAWTLQHELVFYVLFGILFFSGILWLGLTLWLALIIIFYFYSTEYSVGAAGIIFSLINIEFGFGILAALAFSRKVRLGYWPSFVMAGFLLAVWIVTGADRQLSFLVGCAIAFLMLEIAINDADGALKTPRWLSFLGDASYSIYLVHPIAIAIVARALSGLTPSVSVEVGLFILIVSGVLAGVFYHIVYERFAVKLVRQWIDESVRDDASKSSPIAIVGRK